VAKHGSYLIEGSDGRKIPVDLHVPEVGNDRVPVIIFLHGFKGFKDWGTFPLACEMMSRSGFAVARFNFSWNGTRPDNPMEFCEPEQFGRNTFVRELDDLDLVIENLWWTISMQTRIDPERLGLLGHSRGGGTAILKAAVDARIKAVATWASVSDFEKRMNPPDLVSWQEKGVTDVVNTRTGQVLPMYIDIRNDFYANQSRLDIQAATRSLQIPQLIVHGTNDESVLLREAEALKIWNPFAEFVELHGANHTFGGKHPWEEKTLPDDTIKAIQATTSFFRQNL
jgi:dipeptidyl aminopeptidase/acylaminoacyl peptidase